jgi:hypothetical protein
MAKQKHADDSLFKRSSPALKKLADRARAERRLKARRLWHQEQLDRERLDRH